MAHTIDARAYGLMSCSEAGVQTIQPLQASDEQTKRQQHSACHGGCNQGRMCTCAPKPAEAATDIGADDEGDRSGDLPEGAGLIISAAIGGTIAAVAMAWHMWAGFFQ